MTTDVVPPPLASFDDQGQPTTISYQLPEPNRIIGKHYLILDDYDDDFKPVQGEVRPADGTGSSGGTTGTPTAAFTGPSIVTPTGGIVGGPLAVLTKTSNGVAAVTDGSDDLRLAVVCPESVVLRAPDPADDTNSIVLVHGYPLSEALEQLTWSRVQAIADAGKQATIYRSASGQWHYRVANAPVVAGSSAGSTNSSIAPSALPGPGPAHPLPDPPIDPPTKPAWVAITIDSPTAAGGDLHGPSDGYGFAVSGTIRATSVSGLAVTVYANGAEIRDGEDKPAAINGSSWSLVPAGKITTAGTVSLEAVVTGTSADGAQVSNHQPVTVNVVLDLPPAGNGRAPTVTIDDPGQWVQPSGDCLVGLTGTFDTNGSAALRRVILTVPGLPDFEPTYDDSDGRVSVWRATVLLPAGRHTISARGENVDGLVSPTVSAVATVVRTTPFRRLERKLVLAETMVLSSYAAGVAAGDVVKVFSLLPGEEATFTCSSYTKETATAKSAASVLDSNSTEASADFEDTLSDERATKQGTSHETDLGLEASAGASFGVGSASLKASVNDKANSSREDTAKAVSSALSKHASKAASNRSVTINTETSTTTETEDKQDSTRSVKNINVGRVLNYVFRRMLQEHLVTLSVTDVVLLDCTVDLMLGDDGQPLTGPGGEVIRRSVRQYSLAELPSFAADNLEKTVAGEFGTKVKAALSSIVDYTGTMQSLVEEFIPNDDQGVPQPAEKYLRVRPNLKQVVTTTTGSKIAVDGIVIRSDVIAMPSDALVVDAILGGGLALDAYSQGLQAVAVDERRAQVAKEALAQQIVASRDEAAGEVWKKVYSDAPDYLAIPTTSGTGA